MIRLVILTILFISSFSFGAVNENLNKVMESQKHILTENTITSEDVNKKQTEQKNNNQTTGNTSKPAENTQTPNNNKTNQTQSNKNTTTQNSENKVTQSNTTPVPTTKPTVQAPKCEGNKHGIETGNSGRWFDTEQQAIALYNAEIKKWGDKWTNDEIDDETYYKNCPYGYEDWSCPLCHKWTINLYYN